TVSSCCSSQEKLAVEEKKSGCCDGTHPSSAQSSEIDPVCGMSVHTATDLKTEYQTKTYYFCNPSCLEKFKGDPEFYLIPADQRP
ncbi:YHS domain-containing protein, partial [Eggerthella lenta]|nr:YHS domain-containing protein [Eggerthella lenta]